jgi:hypothetical protein
MKLKDFKRYEICDYNTQHMVLIECFHSCITQTHNIFCVCHNVTMNNLYLIIVGLMAHEFDELALDGHNYPTWTMDIKISLALRGIYEAIVPPAYRQQELPPTHK